MGIGEAVKKSPSKAREWRARRDAETSWRNRAGAEREAGAARGTKDDDEEDEVFVAWPCEGYGLEAPAGTSAC